MEEELIRRAQEALKSAYAPYSKYKVGAAVKDENGNVFAGCNIENASYGATVCAERVAIWNAVSHGSRKIVKIAITSMGSIPYPCGICRQVMEEFMSGDGIIILEHGGVVERYTLEELFPRSFKM